MATPREDEIAELLAPVDRARAVYFGLVVIGHRKSIEAGEMFWALPGREVADSVTCKRRDPTFHVVIAPIPGHLRSAQAAMKEILR